MASITRRPFCEVFTASLPSPCNIYLSGKNNNQGTISTKGEGNGAGCTPGTVLRFATEGHSLAVGYDGVIRERSKNGRSKKYRNGQGDEYSLSVNRLPRISSSRWGKENTTGEKTDMKSKPIVVEDRGSSDVLCLAHSSLQLTKNNARKEHKNCLSSIEVFAMASLFSNGNHPSDATTVGSVNDQKSAAAGSTDNNSQDAGSVDASVAAKGNTSSDGKGASAINDSEKEKYFLMIKTRSIVEDIKSSHHGEIDALTRDNALPCGEEEKIKQSGNIAGTLAKDKPSLRSVSVVEKIPLDFRPTLIHAAELHFSRNKSNLTGNVSNHYAVGLFVASADDNKLRLFVSTREKLQASFVNEDCTSSSSFVQVSLSEAIGTSSSASILNNDGILQNDGNKYGADPFSFPTPIMAIDACVSNALSLQCKDDGTIEPQGDSSDEIEANRLAVSCYDGTIRIFTYNIQFDGCSGKENPAIGGGNESCGIQPGGTGLTTNLSPSSFKVSDMKHFEATVDGPVVTLHFGKSMIPDFYAKSDEQGVSKLVSNTFLVAGSLCGFACLFFELPSPTSDFVGNFCGPTTIVDGLYDAEGEGYDDCVTSVHACCLDRMQSIVAVGTQGGRLLVFHPVLRVLEYCKNTTEKTIAIKERVMANIKKLRDEKESISEKVIGLTGDIIEYQRMIENLKNQLTEKNMKCEERDEIPSLTTDSGKVKKESIANASIDDADKYLNESNASEDETGSQITSQNPMVESQHPDDPEATKTVSTNDSDESRDHQNLDEGENTHTDMTHIEVDHNEKSSSSSEIFDFEIVDDEEETNGELGDFSKIHQELPDSQIAQQNSYDPLIDAKAADLERSVAEAEISEEFHIGSQQLTNENTDSAESIGEGERSRSTICAKIATFESNLESAEKELAEVQRGEHKVLSALAELETTLEKLVTASGSIMCSQTMQETSLRARMLGRKSYRYEFLWEHRLPYPIHGIASNVFEEGRKSDLLVSTRRSIHAFRR